MLPKLERWPKKCGPIVWFRLRAASIPPWAIGSIWRGGCFLTLPKRGNPTFFFHSLHGGKERAWFDKKSATCDLLDPARDSQSVPLAGDKGFQDQQIQSPLHEGRRSR